MLKRYRTGVKTVTDADGKVTAYAYDNMGNLTSITDANNQPEKSRTGTYQ